MTLCFTILICDMTWNLIAINKLRLTEVQDPSFEVSRFRFDEFIKFDEFVSMLPVVHILQVVFIANDR